MRTSLRLALLLVVLALSACGRAKTAQECSVFIDKVNESLKRIEKHTQAEARDDTAAVAEMRRLADQYDTLANDVRALRITNRDLKKHALEYQKMAGRAAAAARQVARAVEAKDIQQAKEAQDAFDEIVKREDKLVARINALCQKS